MKQSILAKNIRKLRLTKGIKQNELAEIINVNTSTISNYENGKRIPDIEIIKSLSQYFNVSIDDLTKDENIQLTEKKLENNINNNFFSYRYLLYEVKNTWLRILYLLVIIMYTFFIVFVFNDNDNFLYIFLLIIYILIEIIHLFIDKFIFVKIINVGFQEKVICSINDVKINLNRFNKFNILLLHYITIIGFFSFGLSLTYLSHYFPIEHLSIISIYFIILIFLYIIIFSNILSNKYNADLEYKDYINNRKLFLKKSLLILNGLLFFFISMMMMIINDDEVRSLKIIVIISCLITFLLSIAFWISNVIVVKKYNYFIINLENSKRYFINT